MSRDKVQIQKLTTTKPQEKENFKILKAKP